MGVLGFMLGSTGCIGVASVRSSGLHHRQAVSHDGSIYIVDLKNGTAQRLNPVSLQDAEVVRLESIAVEFDEDRD